MICLPIYPDTEVNISTIWLPNCGWCTRSICRKVPLFMLGYNDYISKSYVNYVKETNWNFIW